MRGLVVALLGAASVVEVNAAPPLSGIGIRCGYYFTEDLSMFTDYPDYGSLTPRSEGVDRIHLALSYIAPGFSSQCTGFLTVTTAGTHSFTLTPTNSIRMFIDGALLMNSGGVADVDLSIGQHEVRIEYFVVGLTGGEVLSWEWQQPDDEDMAEVPIERLNPLACPFVVDGFCALSPFGVGMHTAVYNGGSSLTAFPDFDSSSAVASWKANVDFTVWPDAGLVDTYFASRHTGYLTVMAAGDYKFTLESDGGSRLFIDGELVIDDFGVYSPFTKTATTSLSCGQYEVRIEFFGEVSKPHLKWKWQQPGEDLVVVVPQGRLNPLICPTVNAAGRCEAPPLSGLGMNEQLYVGTGDGLISTSDYPDFDDITPTAASTQEGIDIDSAYLYYRGCCYGLAIRYTAYLTVSKAGIHSFSLDSGNATSSRMFIDGVLIAAYGGVDAVYLLAGQYEVRVEFFHGIRVWYLQWKWQQPGEEMVLVPKERLTPLTCLTIDAAGRCKGGMRTAVYRAKPGELLLDFPSFETRNPDEIWEDGRNVDFSDDDWSAATYINGFASRHSGYLHVPQSTTYDGTSYTFSLTSDDGSRMFLDGTEIINNGGLHGERTVEATVSLEPGMHEVRIEYFEHTGGQMLRWKWATPTQSLELEMVVVPLEVLFPLYCLRVYANGRCQPEVTLA
ncbi:hypothetical protein DIPPA_31769 [Diplonema papillatum]|nr:hypothetical protein DIPPA_31769 [Diplonema papillatum]